MTTEPGAAGFVTGWRIVKRALADRAFTGEGARLYGGRWNSPGRPVVYLGGSPATAALEVLAHAGTPDHLTEFMAVPVRVPEQHVQHLDDLPADWRQSPAPSSTRRAGTAWAASGASAVLRVPSVIVPWESNYVVAVDHPDFSRIEVHEPLPFQFDRRLEP